MRKRFRLISMLIIFTFMCHAAIGEEQDTTPVAITFDSESERVDLISGERLPDFKQAKRGSMLFYLDRLDHPDDFFNFYHDGVRQADPASLRFIKKLDSRYDLWRFRYKNGGKNTPRIHHKVVSFIPLDESGNPKDRVFILFNDLSYIEWGSTSE